MPLPGRSLPALVVLALLLSGCTSSPGGSATSTSTGPAVITDPGDFSNATAGAHIHDYWGGADRKTVVEFEHPGGDAEGAGPGYAQGDAVPVQEVQPEPGHVVPQGTSSLNVTWSWSDAMGDQYSTPQLWVKSAAEAEPRFVADIGNGDTVEVPTTAADADLPHQGLSAWVFELRMASGDLGFVRFKGSTELVVEATRGLELPVFPAHPDPWGSATELPLFNEAGSFLFFEDAVDHGCNGMCSPIHKPGDGIIVPSSAAFVVIELALDTPAPVALQYHSANSREFAAVDPESTEPLVQRFRIAVNGEGDGPYAPQSQWEFRVAPAPGEPIEVGTSSYRITATAHK